MIVHIGTSDTESTKIRTSRLFFHLQGNFTFVVSTPLDIKLSANGAAIDVMITEPNGGRIETYSK